MSANPPFPPPLSAARALLGALLLSLGPACGGGADDGSRSATPSEAPGEGQGLVVLDSAERPEDPAERGITGHEGHGHGDDGRAYFHDFGVVLDGRVSHVFRLQNTDPVPLTIARMKPSCGCTVPSVTYTRPDGEVVRGIPSGEPEILTVPPGAVVELEVAIDADAVKQKNVRRLQTVRVQTDSLNDPFLTLECSIFVQQSFRVERDRVDLRRIARSVGGRASGRVIQYGGSGERIRGLGQVPEGFSASVAEEDAVGNAVWRIDVEALPPLPPGPFVKELELLTETAEGEPTAPFRVPISGMVIADVEIVPSRVILRGFKDDGGAEATVALVSNVPGARLAVLGLEAEGAAADMLDLSFEPVDPDGNGKSARWDLHVATRPGIEEDRFSGSIRVRLDDPQTPELRFTYAGL